MSRCSPPFTTLAILVCGVVVWASPSGAQPAKVGPEIEVVGPQEDLGSPRVAMDPGGSFTVVWEELDDHVLRARSFWWNGNAQGGTFSMSSSDPSVEVDANGFFEEDQPFDIAADAAGNVLVAYHARQTTPGQPCHDYSCIWTKRRDANGDVAPADFVVGDPLGNDGGPLAANPELAVDGNGQFVAAWEGYDAHRTGGFARRLVSSGQLNGSQFRVNEGTLGYQAENGYLDVAADAQGNFAVAWQDDSYEPTTSGIVVQRFDAAKNRLGFQIQVTDDYEGYIPRIAMQDDGAFMVVWREGGGVDGQVFDSAGAPAGPPFEVSADGSHPEIAELGSNGFVVAYSGPAGVLGRTFDSSGAATSAEFQVNTLASYGYPHVSGAADGRFVVSWWDQYILGSIWAQRFESSPPTAEEVPVVGKVLVLTNKDPDDFEKSSGKWKASGSEIVSPLRGSENDPRCNGDPDGTVKATVRFLSATSGEDVSHGLPCQNWTVTGSNKVGSVAKRGYKYSDPKRADGPCNAVKIKGTKSVSVSCKGKPGAASFAYDLEAGVSQGAVTVVLEMGSIQHCAEFQPFLNGSDGKKYKGKALAAPATCP